MIPGIILAAGLSSRMGRSKALLRVRPDGPTFVRQLIETLLAGGVADVIVIGRVGDEALSEEVAAAGSGVRLFDNPRADEGQLSSLVAGVNAADHPGVRAVLVTPVDAPLILPATVQTLLAEFAGRRVPLVRATCGGRHGHPVIFDRSLFDALRHADPAIGAKAVVRAHTGPLADVEVDDSGVLHDIDRLEDYERVIRSEM